MKPINNQWQRSQALLYAAILVGVLCIAGIKGGWSHTADVVIAMLISSRLERLLQKNQYFVDH
jgi:hypothetical protein